MSIIFADRNTAVLPNAKAVVTLDSAPGASPTQPTVQEFGILNSQEIISWGDSNDFPQQILRKSRQSTIIPQAMSWKANLISKEVMPFEIDYDDDGTEKLRYVKDNEIYEFLNNRHFKRYMRESANDLFWFMNVFPEMILSKDRRKITHLWPNEAAYCRIGKQNKQGVSEFVYVNANWPNAAFNSEETHKIRMLDPYEYDLVNWTREQYPSTFKFIYPSSYPTPGNSFYQLAPWDGIRSSGWLDVLERVPVLKKSLIDQVLIKYHIKVPREHWENSYGADVWKKMDFDSQQSAKKELADEINRRITGAEKGGVTIMTEFGVSSIDGKSVEGWSIEPLPDKLKDGAYLADNMEATAHLLYALGLDPALVGFASKEMGARNGGSDKRESLLIYLSQLEPYQDVLFEPLNFVADFNGWKKKYPKLKFRTKQTILTTLDTGAGAKDIAT